MFDDIRSRLDRRKHRRISDGVLLSLYELGANNLLPPDEPAVIRKLSDRRLHEWVALAKGDAKVALDRELRRREAWAAPAGRAVWISIGALAVSIAAIAVSLWK